MPEKRGGDDIMSKCNCCGIDLTPSMDNPVYSTDISIADSKYTICQRCMHVIRWVEKKGKKSKATTEKE